MNGRIESYIHNDSVTPHKGGCLVRVICQTDFAAKTDEFIHFSKHIVKMVYAAQKSRWDEVIEVFPLLEDNRKDLSQLLKEQIIIDGICFMKL